MSPREQSRHCDEESLVLYHYGESDRAEWIEAHLQGCETCRDEHRALVGVLDLMSDSPVPDRPADYGTEVWRRLASRLEARPAIMRRGPPARLWGLAAAAVLLVAVGFLAGRFTGPAIDVPAKPIPRSTRERILYVAVGDYLERSQMVLVELANLDDREGFGSVDISGGRARAQELLADGRLYRESASLTGDAGLAWVLEELERILLDIAHSPSEVTRAELSSLQERIERQGILLKIRVIESRVRERERTTTEKSAGRT